MHCPCVRACGATYSEVLSNVMKICTDLCVRLVEKTATALSHMCGSTSSRGICVRGRLRLSYGRSRAVYILTAINKVSSRSSWYIYSRFCAVPRETGVSLTYYRKSGARERIFLLVGQATPLLSFVIP